MDYELIADDDSMVLKNGKILSGKIKDNITFILVELASNNKIVKVNFCVDNIYCNVEIEEYQDDIIITWDKFYINSKKNYDT